MTIWKADIGVKTKRDFFQTITVSVLLYVCIIWTLTERPKREPDDKDVSSYFEQILGAVSYKKVIEWPLTSNLSNNRRSRDTHNNLSIWTPLLWR